MTAPSDPPRTYAYSFDRETFVGRYPDRAAALAAGREELADRSFAERPPEAVYVARRVPIDYHASGHAAMMAQTLRDAFEETAARDAGRLKRPAADDLAALDRALAAALIKWMRDRKLVAQGAAFESISEHPLPSRPHVRSTARLEVGPLGES